ncbi:hypothetical protein ACHAWU_005050 [Discostella pseudostelligera]|uniref:SAC domain-containing protein n=1 Tax=Discostella pseudostelligera TaxID=259834 RepID=A0ABD3M2Z8_9STRA
MAKSHTPILIYDSTIHNQLHHRQSSRQKRLLQPSSSPTTTTTSTTTITTIESTIEKSTNSILDRKIKRKKKKKKKRGTRTTGVGASTSSLLNADDHDGDDCFSNVDDIDNPMLGKIWVQTSSSTMSQSSSSSSSSLIFKLYPDSNFSISREDDEATAESSKAICIELSERTPGRKKGTTTRKQSGESLHVRYYTAHEPNETDAAKKKQPTVGQPHFLKKEQPASLSSSSSVSSSSTTTSNFIPIEGIYGIYHLPHSGPHIVLITESERVYKSPPPPPSFMRRRTSSSSKKYIPLMELRKITCLEIVSIRNTNRRGVMNDDYEDGDDNDNGVEEARITTAKRTQATMMEEEARQLRLLRKSFAEHDLYFTVPLHYYRHHNNNIRCSRSRWNLNKGRSHTTSNDVQETDCDDDDDDDNDDDYTALGVDAITVPDVTHTLQRSFMGMNSRRHDCSATTANDRIHRWWTQYVTATEDVASTATTKKKENEDKDEEDSDDSIWSFLQHQNRHAGSQIAPQAGIDPRFFWNELPALSLLPPPSSSLSRRLHSSEDDDSIYSREDSSPSTAATITSSPYFHLLDHLIPVTSAFVGVRQNIPIPITSAAGAASSSKSFSNNDKEQQLQQQQQQQDMYDQVLISRRSKYRAGTRFTRRGTDETGNVANYAETEQICFIVSGNNDDFPIVDDEDDDRVSDNSHGDDDTGSNNRRKNLATATIEKEKMSNPTAISTTLHEIYSHVQTRGSIPLHWSSPVMTVGTYRPRVYISVDPIMQARGLRDHLLGDFQRYSLSSLSPSLGREGNGGGDSFGGTTKITMVNLIDKHGDQGRLGRAFDSVLSAVLDVYNTNGDDVDDEEEQEKAEEEDDDADDGGSSLTSVTTADDDDEEDGCGDGSADSKVLMKRHRPNVILPLRGGLTPNSIKHIWYDFHAECKGGRYDRLSQLLEQVIPTLNDQGYFCAALLSTQPNANTITAAPTTWEIRSLQDGVVRTNCMDCLDRTNVVQSMLGRYMLYRQLHQRIGLSKTRNHRSHRRTLPLECVVGYKQRPLTLPWTEGEAAHRYLWADNADAISRLYAGTPALKGDFTRTGKRTRRGALDDGLNSLQRYYLNNFIDADRQEGMDLLVGSVEFDVAMPPSSTMFDDDEGGDGVGRMTDESSRLLMLQELEKRSSKRRGYDGTHARIKVKTGETFGGSGSDGKQGRTNRWMPKDLHYHMKHEAHWSRSPLSAASREENLDAPTSSDYLLQVTSSAAGDEDPLSVNDDSMNMVRSSLVIGDSPWWVVSSSDRDDDDNCNRAVDAGNGVSMQKKLGQKILLGVASKRVVVLSLLLLFRMAPVLVAALILTVMATCGLSQSSAHDHD